MMLSSNGQTDRPRLKAAIIGLAMDGPTRPVRILRSGEFMVVGGSDSTQAEMLEHMLRLEGELERIGRDLAELDPHELAEIAWRIDWLELEEVALRMAGALEDRGQTFESATAEELTMFAGPGEF